MDALAAVFNVAFDHQSLDQFMDIVAVTAAVQDFFGDPDLFQILLVGVGMVHIHDTGRILEGSLGIELTEKTKVLIMIIGKYSAAFRSEERRVGKECRL